MPYQAENKDRCYSYKDYLTWPSEERWQLIDGIPYNMRPSPSTEHQRVLRRLFLKILKGTAWVLPISLWKLYLNLHLNADETRR